MQILNEGSLTHASETTHISETSISSAAEEAPVALFSSIRLRNFAIDPALQNVSEPERGDPSSQGTWHTAEEVSVTSQQTETSTAAPSQLPQTQQIEQLPKIVDFPRAINNLNLRVLIGNGERYTIMSSQRNIALKLFVHESHLKDLPKTAKEWNSVPFVFYPQGHSPQEIEFQFHLSRVVFRARLPVTHEDVFDLIEARRPFCISMIRIERLERYVSINYQATFEPYSDVTSLLKVDDGHMQQAVHQLRHQRELEHSHDG